MSKLDEDEVHWRRQCQKAENVLIGNGVDPATAKRIVNRENKQELTALNSQPPASRR